jgi:hypothetical protein
MARYTVHATDARGGSGDLSERATEPSFGKLTGIESEITTWEWRTGALVDTGAELSWFLAAVLESLGVPRRKLWRFRQADGTVLERWTGPAFLYVAGTTARDDVVFGEPNDLVLLGARSIERLNLRVEPVTKQLVDAGSAPAALTNRLSTRRHFAPVAVRHSCGDPLARPR